MKREVEALDFLFLGYAYADDASSSFRMAKLPPLQAAVNRTLLAWTHTWAAMLTPSGRPFHRGSLP